MTAERAWDPSLCCGPSSRKEGIYSSALGRSSFCFVNKAHKAFLWWWAFRWFKFHNVDLSWKWATVPVDSEAIPDTFRWAELWVWVRQMVLSPQMILWLPEWSSPWLTGVPRDPLSPAAWREPTEAEQEALPRGGFESASSLGAGAMALFSWRLQPFRVRKQWISEFYDPERLLDG